MTSFGLIVLKPDSFADKVSDLILEDIKNAGLEIVLSKFFHFQASHITLLCPPVPKAKEKMYSEFLNNYISGESLILVVKSTHHDAIKYILELKGKINDGGLRRKYFPFDLQEMYSLESADPLRFGYMKARNRLHSPDNEYELKQLLEQVLTLGEIEKLAHLEIDWAKEML